MNTQIVFGSLPQATPETFFSLKIKERKILCYYFPCSLTFQKRVYLKNMGEITPSIFALFCRGRKLLQKLKNVAFTSLSKFATWAAHWNHLGRYFLKILISGFPTQKVWSFGSGCVVVISSFKSSQVTLNFSNLGEPLLLEAWWLSKFPVHRDLLGILSAHPRSALLEMPIPRSGTGPRSLPFSINGCWWWSHFEWHGCSPWITSFSCIQSRQRSLRTSNTSTVFTRVF